MKNLRHWKEEAESEGITNRDQQPPKYLKGQYGSNKSSE